MPYFYQLSLQNVLIICSLCMILQKIQSKLDKSKLPSQISRDHKNIGTVELRWRILIKSITSVVRNVHFIFLCLSKSPAYNLAIITLYIDSMVEITGRKMSMAQHFHSTSITDRNDILKADS